MATKITPICCTSFISNGSQDCQSPSLPNPCHFWTVKTPKRIDLSDKLFLSFRPKNGISWAKGISGNNQPKAAPSSSSSSSSSEDTSPKSPWKKWLMGLALTVILPAAGHKGGLILALKGKIDQTIATVESVTDIVEDIAEKADNLVEEIEEKLPDDSKLKEALESFDDLTDVAVQQARRAEDLIHKVKETEEQIASVLMDNSKEKTPK